MAKIKYADFSEEQKARERKRAKQWRVDNPDRVKLYDTQKSLKVSAARAAFRREHPLIRLTEAERRARNKAYNVKWRAANLEHDRQRRKDRYLADPERDKAATRKAQYKRKYGITIAEYDAMVLAQDGRCAVCGTDKPGGVGRWPVDHCSKTGKIRALLCNACNPGLGFFKHDINLLQRAIAYLQAFQP